MYILPTGRGGVGVAGKDNLLLPTIPLFSNAFDVARCMASIGRKPYIPMSRMAADIVFETQNGAPMISITSAFYGHDTNMSLTYNVTSQVSRPVSQSVGR